MAYFDNAATTFPKPDEVYSFMDEFYRHSGGNAGRGQYEKAASAKQLIDSTREMIQTILHCPAKQVIFEPTATIALNIIIQGLIESGVEDVYISPFEHNAVTRTLHHFEKKGRVKVHTLIVNDQLGYDLERIRYQFDNIAPDLVIVSHASNVIGLVAPIEELFALAKKYNAYTVADMAQTAGLVECNVGSEVLDFAVFAGHKTLLGPTGISGFVMKPSIDLPPVLFGGTGFESANQDMPQSLPERFEAGTTNVLGVAGLYAALKWIDKTSIELLWKKEQENRSRLIELLSRYDYISVIGNEPGLKYVGIVSCVINGISSDSAGAILAERGISVRSGLQCAPAAHRFLGTFPAGTVRFSVNYYTNDDDFDALEEVLDDIENELC